MYDFDLHMRFVKSVTEAWFSYATAGMAALGNWQERLASDGPLFEASRAPAMPAGPFGNIFSWWMGLFSPKSSGFSVEPFQFSPSFNALPSFSDVASFNPFGSMKMFQDWSDMLKAWGFPQLPWSAFEVPMTAWLVAAGMPYTVASPTARGNAASLDAAEAAREGMQRMFSAMRSDGGHAISFLPKRPQ